MHHKKSLRRYSNIESSGGGPALDGDGLQALGGSVLNDAFDNEKADRRSARRTRLAKEQEAHEYSAKSQSRRYIPMAEVVDESNDDRDDDDGDSVSVRTDKDPIPKKADHKLLPKFLRLKMTHSDKHRLHSADDGPFPQLTPGENMFHAFIERQTDPNGKGWHKVKAAILLNDLFHRGDSCGEDFVNHLSGQHCEYDENGIDQAILHRLQLFPPEHLVYCFADHNPFSRLERAVMVHLMSKYCDQGIDVRGAIKLAVMIVERLKLILRSSFIRKLDNADYLSPVAINQCVFNPLLTNTTVNTLPLSMYLATRHVN